MRRAAIFAIYLLAAGSAVAQGPSTSSVGPASGYPAPARLPQTGGAMPPAGSLTPPAGGIMLPESEWTPPPGGRRQPAASAPLGPPAGTILRVQGIAEQVPSPAALPLGGIPADGPGSPAVAQPQRPGSPTAPQLRRSAPLQVLPVSNPELVSLHAEHAELPDVLRMIARNHGLNLVIGPGVIGQVTLSVENAQLEEVLDAILGVSGFAWNRRGNLLYVTRLSPGERLEASVQGRLLRIFALNYMSAADAQGVAAGLLSPIGQVFVSESDPEDQTRTRELLVVEDVPEAVARVEAYLAQVDHPPRQVLIEAHVLQVTLDDENRHGVNLGQLLRLGNASLQVESLRQSGETAADGGILAPTDGMLITLKGTDISGLVELIQSQTQARTLASPKVVVANRQQANIQIGQKLGYRTTTTTQTSSLETVNFLETGVVLDVIPVISSDGQILMTITPKVSNGRVVDDLPEEDTTQLTTTVLLPDGGGVVIGGLIKEESSTTVSGVPGLSKVPYLGALFRRKAMTDRRTEIIIAMVTRVVPTVESIRAHELCELQKALPPHAAADLQSSMALPPQFISPELFHGESTPAAPVRVEPAPQP